MVPGADVEPVTHACAATPVYSLRRRSLPLCPPGNERSGGSLTQHDQPLPRPIAPPPHPGVTPTLRIPVATAEAERTALILEHDLPAAGGDAQLEAITGFAAALCQAPIALVSLVEEDRQRFLARTGLDAAETPRETSFCAFAMLQADPMIIGDASRDPRFAHNPLVTGAPHIRFYAGMPLISEEGVPLGALCVIDSVPRGGLTPLQKQGLRVLADDVVARLETRRRARESREARAEARAALSESDSKFRILADTMPQMVWSTRPDGYHDYYNARWYEFTGMKPGSTDGEEWNGMFHADDQPRAWERWRHSLATGEPYDIEYRLRHHSGQYRWTLGRALPMRDPDGRITRWFGTCTDIHEQKLSMEEREVISQELSHRIKNIFSVVAGLIGYASKSHPEIAPVARDLRDRVLALGRAHDFVRPHSPESRPVGTPSTLHGLLQELFAPYQSEPGERLVISGTDLPIDDRSATPLSLLFHELATNAAKYGALSQAGGRITLEIVVEDADVRMTWREQGGPAVTLPTKTGGFGSQLISLSVERQLAGRYERSFAPAGLDMTIAIPIASLNRPARIGST